VSPLRGREGSRVPRLALMPHPPPLKRAVKGSGAGGQVCPGRPSQPRASSHLAQGRVGCSALRPQRVRRLHKLGSALRRYLPSPLHLYYCAAPLLLRCTSTTALHLYYCAAPLHLSSDASVGNIASSPAEPSWGELPSSPGPTGGSHGDPAHAPTRVADATACVSLATVAHKVEVPIPTKEQSVTVTIFPLSWRLAIGKHAET